MFEEPQYIQSTFSLFFVEQRAVNARERQIYARLRGRYFPAKLLVSPNEVDPDAPRLVFQSQHGHSQIVIGGTNATLNVTYSPDWQTKPTSARGYVIERAHLLFDVLKVLSDEEPLFCGSVTRVHMPASASDEAVAALIAQAFASGGTTEAYHDANVKTTVVIEDRFFSNITVQNYRLWTVNSAVPTVFRLSRFAAAERGVEIIGDFNSRYAFNEDKSLKVTRELAAEVLDKNLEVVGQTIQRVKGAIK